jgi:TRAP-type C4-dicarboxylate transport system permease small subunit
MKRIFAITNALSTYFYWVSGVALGCILLITVTDVILRMFDRPITGVYDITCACAGVVVGLALPLTTWKKAHVYLDFLIDRGSVTLKKILTTLTTCCGIFLFLAFGWEFILLGIRLYKVGEVSGTISLPLYPFTLGIGVSFLINALVLLGQWVAIFEKGKKT